MAMKLFLNGSLTPASGTYFLAMADRARTQVRPMAVDQLYDMADMGLAVGIPTPVGKIKAVPKFRIQVAGNPHMFTPPLPSWRQSALAQGIIPCKQPDAPQEAFPVPSQSGHRT